MTALRSPALQAVLALVALAWGAPPASAEQGSTPHWTYEGDHGPSHWGSLDAAYGTCRAGRHQSPIDIHGAKTVALPPIVFAYKPSPLRIIDNGHTVQVTYAPGSFITVGDQQYELQQLHFHHPAEETVDGRSYPLEAHLVHKNAKGALAVVAVLLTSGNANEFLETVWSHFPREPEAEIAPDGVSVDAGSLLPAVRGYFTYTGSLTTPPCTEDVTWFVLKAPVPMSDAQVAAFARRYPHNSRPVQRLNGRKVQVTN